MQCSEIAQVCGAVFCVLSFLEHRYQSFTIIPPAGAESRQHRVQAVQQLKMGLG
jgi:hypothetical protein